MKPCIALKYKRKIGINKMKREKEKRGEKKEREGRREKRKRESHPSASLSNDFSTTPITLAISSGCRCSSNHAIIP